MNENLLWLIVFLISFVNFLILFEKFWVINVVLDDNVNFKGVIFFFILFFGVVLVINFIVDDGDVCFFVKL